MSRSPMRACSRRRPSRLRSISAGAPGARALAAAPPAMAIRPSARAISPRAPTALLPGWIIASPPTPGRLRAGRRRHQLGPGANSRHRKERRPPGRHLRQDLSRPRLPRGLACLHQPLDEHQPHRARRSDHRQLQCAELWRTARDRLPLRGAPPLGVTPYAALQAQSFHTPSYSETDLAPAALGSPTRP